jgi:hypothetical protein
MRGPAVLVAFALVAMFACVGGDPGNEPPSTIPLPSAPTASAPSPQPRTDDARMFVRTCESSVYGELGAGWRRREISAGSVTFVGARGYADDPERWFSAPAALARSHKVLVVVVGERAVMLSVRHPDAALAYDPERWRLSDTVPFRLGYPLTRFEPCAGDQRATQFNGAFLLRGPSCVPVEVRPQDRAPLYVTLSFGAGECD